MPHILSIDTPGRGLVEITGKIRELAEQSSIRNGLINVFVQHTSASLFIQENADPDVGRDLMDFLERVAPEDDIYRHSAEGPDDMPAHIRAMLTETSLTIPMINGAPMLGTWQGVFLVEHRRAAHCRRVIVSFIKDDSEGG